MIAVGGGGGGNENPPLHDDGSYDTLKLVIV